MIAILELIAQWDFLSIWMNAKTSELYLFKYKMFSSNLSKPNQMIQTYSNIFEPIWTNPNLSELIQTYPNLSKPI